MHQKESLDLIHIRNLLEPPSPKTIASIMQDVFYPYEETVSEWLEKEKEFIIDQLVKLRISTHKETGRLLSCPVLCADLLMRTVVKALKCSAKESLDSEEHLDFLFRMDVAYGMAATFNTISIAETWLREGDQSTMKRLTELEEAADGSLAGSPLMAEKVELYTQMEAFTQDLVPFLKEDPSGFRLLDSCLQQLKEQPNKPGRIPQIVPGQTVEFVVAGAELAVKAYKALYPLAQASLQSDTLA